MVTQIIIALLAVQIHEKIRKEESWILCGPVSSEALGSIVGAEWGAGVNVHQLHREPRTRGCVGIGGPRGAIPH